jgi:pimeloyl-ACP methyl ester carboxylesterase
MEKSLAIKIISIMLYVLFGVSLLIGVLFFINKNENSLLVWAYVLVGLSMGAAVIFALVNMFKTKKNVINSLIALGAFVVLYAISYALADDTIQTNAAGELFDITAGTSKMSGMLLYSLYILLGASFLSLIYSEIRGAFK